MAVRTAIYIWLSLIVTLCSTSLVAVVIISPDMAIPDCYTVVNVLNPLRTPNMCMVIRRLQSTIHKHVLDLG